MREIKTPPLRSSLGAQLSKVHNQDLKCTLCGYQWIGTNRTCPSCNGVAKSDGEVTKKTFQGDDDLKKAF